ncbi:MAG TPA: GNAT family N-acetyltransferase [Anaerolineales bacterium]|nr:GNAT family N-acetyltransferase [Anaerolineales bacterium]
MNKPEEITIEEWRPDHARWTELLALVTELNQMDWLNFTAEWHHSSHVLVAQHDLEILGFLRFVVQEIGPDMDCPPVHWRGENLREAKVIAFGVLPAQRHQGIGRSLQEALRQRAQDLGCYQIRSHSSGDNSANHQLKLSLGYGVHPIIRGEDSRGVYFILPLQRQLDIFQSDLMDLATEESTPEAPVTIPVNQPPKTVNQGDVYWVPVEETEYTHPHVVIQENVINHSRVNTVVVCALSTNLKRASAPGNVLLDAGEANVPSQSVVIVSQVSSVDKRQLGAYIGSLSQERLNQILSGMQFLQSMTGSRRIEDP